MTKKKKAAWVAGVLVMVMAITGFGFAVNSGDCGFGSFHRHGFYKRGLPPFMYGEIKGFILWRMDKEAKDLSLSGVQQEQYEIFRTQFLETMEKAIETRTQFHKTAFTTLEDENPDLAGMATEAKKHVETISGVISEGLARFAEFFNSLDQGQKKIITDKIKERINDHKSSYPCYQKEI
ncbi:MAG: hypothetical protein WC836_21110 [Desulfobacula sp.]|jgi:hypothetical protein